MNILIRLFRKDRETIDIIFTVRYLQEKCQEQNVDPRMLTFCGLTWYPEKTIDLERRPLPTGNRTWAAASGGKRMFYMTFVDLNKAFGRVSCDGLWKVTAKFVCRTRFIAMVWQFHDDMIARVQNDGENLWQMEEARLCTGTDTFQHDSLSHAYTWFPELWWWLFNQILLW